MFISSVVVQKQLTLNYDNVGRLRSVIPAPSVFLLFCITLRPLKFTYFFNNSDSSHIVV